MSSPDRAGADRSKIGVAALVSPPSRRRSHAGVECRVIQVTQPGVASHANEMGCRSADEQVGSAIVVLPGGSSSMARRETGISGPGGDDVGIFGCRRARRVSPPAFRRQPGCTGGVAVSPAAHSSLAQPSHSGGYRCSYSSACDRCQPSVASFLQPHAACAGDLGGRIAGGCRAQPSTRSMACREGNRRWAVVVETVNRQCGSCSSRSRSISQRGDGVAVHHWNARVLSIGIICVVKPAWLEELRARSPSCRQQDLVPGQHR